MDISKYSKYITPTSATVVLISFPILYFLKKYINGPLCKIKRNLSEKIILITGSNTGIGYETALELSKQKATVILACRNQEKGKKALESIQKKSNNKNVYFMQLDLNDLENVKKFCKEFAEKFNRLDVLVNNAGIFCPTRQETKQNFERTMGINHLGHFLLTDLLMPILEKTPKSRIVNVSSRAHRVGEINFDDLMLKKSYFSFKGYANSKLANIFFTYELQRIFNEKNQEIKTVSLHPGAVKTEIARDINFILYFIYKYIIGFFLKNVKMGAQTTLYCCLEDWEKLQGGKYYTDCKVQKVFPTAEENAKNLEIAKKFWILSEKLIHDN